MYNVLSLPKIIRYKLLCSFINRLSISTILPFVPIVLTNLIGKMGTIVLIVTIVCQFSSSIFGGYLSDRRGHKSILLLGQTSNLLCYILMSIFLYYHCIFYFVCILILNAILGNIHSGTKGAILLDDTTKETRYIVYSLDYWITNLTMTCGLFLGGLLFEKYLYLLYAFFAVTTAITMYIYQVKMSFQNNDAKIEKNSFFANMYEILKDKRYLLFIVGSLFIFSIESTFASIMSIKMYHDFNAIVLLNITLSGIQQFIILQMVNTIVILLFTHIITSKINKHIRFKMKYIYLFSVIFNVFGYIFSFYTSSIFILLPLVVIISFSEIIYAPIRQLVQMNLIPKHKRAIYLSISTSILQIMNVLASINVFFYWYFGINILILFTIIIAILGVILTYRYID